MESLMLNQMTRPHKARKGGQDHQDTSRVSVEAILEVNPQCPAIGWYHGSEMPVSQTHPIP